jgi:hypothetical protein
MSEVTSVNGKTGAVVLKAAEVEAVATAEVGHANGVASLNSSGMLPEGQLPTSVVLRSGEPGTKDQLLQVRSDGTVKWTDPVEISMKAWGVDHTGTMDTTTKEQEAITFAAEVGGTVRYAGGIIKRTGAPPKIPVNLKEKEKGLKIEGAGMFATIFRLESGALRAFDFATTSPGNTVGNIELTDFTVDGTKQTSEKGDHVVIGTFVGGTEATQVNIEHCWVRRVRTINIPTQLGEGVQGRHNVAFSTWHGESGLALNNIADIGVEDCEFNGGTVGVMVAAQAPLGEGAAPRASANVFIDDIHIRRLKHICPAPTEHGECAHVQIGAQGWGRRVFIEDLIGEGSGDVGVEIDNMTDATVQNALVVNQWNAAFLATNFVCCGTSEPVSSSLAAEVKPGTGPVTLKLAQATGEKFKVGSKVVIADTSEKGANAEIVTVEHVVNSTTIEVSTVLNKHPERTFVEQLGNVAASQRFLFSDCRAHKTTSVNEIAACGFSVQNSENVLPLGEVSLQACEWLRNSTDVGTLSGEALKYDVAPTGSARTIKVRDFVGCTEGVSYAGSESLDPCMMRFVGPGCPTLPATFLDIEASLSYTGRYTGSGGGIEVNMIRLDKVKAMFDFKVSLAVSFEASGKKPQRMMLLCKEDETSAIQGRIKLRIPPSTSDEPATLVGIRFPAHAGVISGMLEVDACDFSGLPTSSPPIKVEEAGAKLSINRGQSWNKPPEPVTIAVGASEAETRLITGYAGLLELNGGKATEVLLSKDEGKHFTAVLVQASAALPYMTLAVENGDVFKVKYTEAPSAKLIPSR